MAKVTTFYSYKGGSGRSMTMANVAWALATNGERVLAIDWDLEAPGLHRYFHPFLSDPEQERSTGLIDRIWTYIEGLGGNDKPGLAPASRFSSADCEDIVQPLELPTRSKGCLHLLGAGRQDDEYSDKVGGLDWASFYARFDGGTFIERLMEWARGSYTHVLIDSRTGVADTAGICTAQVPDSVIMCVVYNRQSIEGSAAIARSIVRSRIEREQAPLEVRFIPCRVEERGEVDAARLFAAARLGEALELPRGAIERQLRRDEIRHYPWCAFEEKLAVFEDAPGGRGSLLDAMHELAREITGRQKLKIEEFDSKLLASIWRRAAFADPRLADLSTLQEATIDEAYSHLLSWVDEALDAVEERPDWLMALGEAAVSYAGRGSTREPNSTSEFLGRSGLRIAHRAMEHDPAQYTVRYAILLYTRAGQLQEQREFHEAFELANHSFELMLRDESRSSNWRAVRALERMAEISLANEEPDRALSLYREVAERYCLMNRRELPLGAAIEPARALRVLAEQLLEHGDPREADQVAAQAVKQLGRLGKTRGRRDAAEVVNILATRAEIAAFVNADTAHREIMKVRLYAKDVIDSSTSLNQLERRLHIAEARLRLNRGDFDSALGLLELAANFDPEGDHAANEIFELRVDILLNAGREQEAAELLLNAIENGSFTPSRDFLILLRRASAAAGWDEMLDAKMTDIIGSSEKRDLALLKFALDWVVSKNSDRPEEEIFQMLKLIRNSSHDPHQGSAKTDKKS